MKLNRTKLGKVGKMKVLIPKHLNREEAEAWQKRAEEQMKRVEEEAALLRKIAANWTARKKVS